MDGLVYAALVLWVVWVVLAGYWRYRRRPQRVVGALDVQRTALFPGAVCPPGKYY
jgi:hypothetical protein